MEIRSRASPMVRSTGACSAQAIAIRDDILTDADVSADRVKVDGAAADPQDGMLGRDAGVPQDDVGACVEPIRTSPGSSSRRTPR
jgi:hypothetical protein